jgi:hypothetical protein
MAIRREFKAVYTGMLLLGLFLAYCAFTHFRWAVRLVRGGEITTAKVVAVKYKEGYRNDKKKSMYRAYCPEYAFVTRENVVHRFEHTITSERPGWRIGQETNVVYDPADPRRVNVIGYWPLFLGGILLASLAAPLVVIGGGYFGYVALMRGLPARTPADPVRGHRKRSTQTPGSRSFSGA